MISLSRSRLRLSKTLVSALMSGACVPSGSPDGITVATHLPAALGGLPQGAPQRPTTSSAYPAVHDMPPSRPTNVLTDAEQTKLESDLVAARNRAAEAAKSAAAADKP